MEVREYSARRLLPRYALKILGPSLHPPPPHLHILLRFGHLSGAIRACHLLTRGLPLRAGQRMHLLRRTRSSNTRAADRLLHTSLLGPRRRRSRGIPASGVPVPGSRTSSPASTSPASRSVRWRRLCVPARSG